MKQPVPAHPHAARLMRLLEVCRVPSKADFIRWVGEQNPQTFRNWSTRGIPADKARTVAKVTGASLDWLLDGQGEPFPAGAVAYAPPTTGELAERVLALQGELSSLWAVVGDLVRIVSAKLPGAGEDAERAFRTLARSTAGHGALRLEALAAFAEESRQASAPASRAAPRTGSGGKPRGKGR